jgi:phosphate:Na+ symporter
MIRKTFLIAIFLVLGYGFWLSPEFKTVAAGVAIFLLGMVSLEQGFKAFSGGVLEAFLKKTTNTTWKSLTFGIVSTTLMQSSSLVSVLTISFLSAGLIALAQGIGIIFGANLGTTTGAWLVAGFGLKIDIAAYALPMLVFGVIMIFQNGSKRMEGTGWILVGLGFLFLGIAYMKEGFEIAGGQVDLSQFAIPGIKGLLIYTGIGIAATVIMQSSHATLILAITALAAGQVSYENALAIAIGSNVGTTVTAMIGSIGASVSGRQLAIAHLIFNLVTGLLAIVFINQFVVAVDWFSGLVGIAADNYTLKFAAFHTLFNLTGVILMLPLINTLVVFLQRVLKEKVEPIHTTHVLFLSDAALEFPDTALNVVTKETSHLAFNSFGILAHGLNLHREAITSTADINAMIASNTEVLPNDITDLYQRKVKPLYSAITDFSIRAEQKMDTSQLDKMMHLRRASWLIVNAIKSMKDMQHNIDRYMGSDNEYIKREYNKIRLNISVLLRVMYRFDEVFVPARVRDQLDSLSKMMEESDIIANGTLDKLIRKNRITPDMATSLMNDSSHSHHIQENLINAAEILMDSTYSGENELSLTKEENEEIIKRREDFLARLQEEDEKIYTRVGYLRSGD